MAYVTIENQSGLTLKGKITPQKHFKTSLECNHLDWLHKTRETKLSNIV